LFSFTWSFFRRERKGSCPTRIATANNLEEAPETKYTMNKWSPLEYHFLLLALLVALAVHPTSGSSSTGHFSSFSPTDLSNLVQDVSRHGHGILTRSIPALRLTQILRRDGSMKTPLTSTTTTIREVAVKTKKKKQQQGSTAKRSMTGPFEILSKLNVTTVGGVYYGISPDTLAKATRPVAKKPTLSDSMAEALEELRTMRQEMETMRKDMQTLKRKMIAEGDIEEDDDATANPSKAALARRKRQREYEKMSAEIERWAKKILYEEGEEDGWNEITCNKMMGASLNPQGQTKTYIKVCAYPCFRTIGEKSQRFSYSVSRIFLLLGWIAYEYKIVDERFSRGAR
jgi:hypothetical protein